VAARVDGGGWSLAAGIAELVLWRAGLRLANTIGRQSHRTSRGGCWWDPRASADGR
jgi:hypothetical protein